MQHDMQELSDESISEIKYIDFGNVAVDTCVDKILTVQNQSKKPANFRASLTYIVNNIDRVFIIDVPSHLVSPGQYMDITITFKPNIPCQSFTDYYVVEDSLGNGFRVTVTGKCFGPKVKLSKNKLSFNICKSYSEHRREVIEIINRSSTETTYQWLLPTCGQGYFQVSTGNCGLIRAHEKISTTIVFTGTSLGVYTAELACVVLNQEPLFLNVTASVVLQGTPHFNQEQHIFPRPYPSRFTHLMENSLKKLTYIPPASVFERYLDFGMGSEVDVTMNVPHTLCVTNHGETEGYIQWMPDPDNVFIIDPLGTSIPPSESKMFAVRFRPKQTNQVYGYLLCGDYQQNVPKNDDEGVVTVKHNWYRIPCVGNTWGPCTESTTEWECPTEVIMPPTIPNKTTFANFMLSNKLEVPMYYKFNPPKDTNYVILPMCGIVPSRGWEIITVAMEPKTVGDYCENWDVIINNFQKARIRFSGTAEVSDVEIMSHGYNPATHAMFEFPATITGCVNYCTAYLHNLTRMEIHIRVLNSVAWLGADLGGSIIIPPKEIYKLHLWFLPKTPNRVYDTTAILTCATLIRGKVAGEPSELFVHIMGYSELPNLKVLPKTTNLHDVVVQDKKSCTVTLFNYGSCLFTSKLYYVINGMGDDYSGDRFEIEMPVNSLKPSTYCPVTFTVTPDGSGSRQIDVKYTVLFRNEDGVIEEIQPVTKTICIVWYDGIYPCMKVERTISVKCPVILSNHCVRNMTNVEALNKAFMDCRPKKPLSVQLYAPDLCINNGKVELIFVLGCVYYVPVSWSIRREKICECPMVEIELALSKYWKKHTCFHRPMFKMSPGSGIVSPENPGLLNLSINYTKEGQSQLCYIMTMSNQRSLHIYVNILAHPQSKGILKPLRRPLGMDEYLAVLDCGTVPINNLDPVIRVVWLYNPTEVYTTWRLLRGNAITPDGVIRCLLYFAEVPPLGKLAIPFAFHPAEMLDHEMVFSCSFGYDNMKILVRGSGGLPNCIESRLDMPSYVPKVIRGAYRQNVVYLSTEHVTIPIMPTHSLSRDIIGICNDTDHSMRFIWLPERIANIVNVVMTPCWGVLQPHSTEWITMSIYSLQEPSTFTTTVACEILDLTERRAYQQNELLRRVKTDQCNQEFIITEKGISYHGINDEPPYVLNLEKPQPSYLSLTVSVSSKGQRDGWRRMLIKQMWEQPPQYDLLSAESADAGDHTASGAGINNIAVTDIVRIIDGILWDALHSKMFRYQIENYGKEEIPTYKQIVDEIEKGNKQRLAKRITSGICDAIVNKAVFHWYGLNPKHEVTLLDAE